MAAPARHTLPGVTLTFESQPCTYTLAQAKAGVIFAYQVNVTQATADVVPTPQDSGQCQTPGASGLTLLAKITEGSQVYCPDCDMGVCQGTPLPATTLTPGVYADNSLTWDGKTWNGPSDTSNPEGPAFTAGAAVVSVTAVGTVNGNAFSVSATLPNTLTP